MDTKLTLSALRMAISDRNPAPGCIHHSDRGVQYASSEYVDKLRSYGFQLSMSRKGNPYDNAVCESFIKTLKDEEVYLWEYRTIEDAERRIPHFIRDVYNEKTTALIRWAITHRMSLRNYRWKIKNQLHLVKSL